MSAAFTPGPWVFRQIDDDGLGYIEADSRDILHAGVTDRPALENIANAHLIAAAPELYEALEELLARDERRYDRNKAGQRFFTDNNPKAIAALAKARGGQ